MDGSFKPSRRNIYMQIIASVYELLTREALAHIWETNVKHTAGG